MRNEPFDAILAQYFPKTQAEPEWVITTGPSGMNNTTRYVAHAGKRYVLRIYETHRDEDKVSYEHHVLDCLLQAPIPGLPTPSPVRASNGGTVVNTPDGRLAALFHHRTGKNPVLVTEADYREFGMAAGSLSVALSGLKPAHEPLYRPYYEHCLPSQAAEYRELFATLRKPDAIVSDLPDALHAAETELARLQEQVEVFRSLPHQLIHGDLNASNVLADEGNRIVALLDFEFVAWDLRVMELAVCLSESAEQASLSRMHAMMDGFLQQVPLTREELVILPDLLLLRRLDVFFHFLRRWMDGVDTPETVRRFLLEVQGSVAWLNRYGALLVQPWRPGGAT